MHLSAEWKMSKYPTFNLGISSKEGKEPFLVIKGCRIVDGQKGEFLSWPSKKTDEGKWIDHVYATPEFKEAALKVAKAAKPSDSNSMEDLKSDVPW